MQSFDPEKYRSEIGISAGYSSQLEFGATEILQQVSDGEGFLLAARVPLIGHHGQTKPGGSSP